MYLPDRIRIECDSVPDERGTMGNPWRSTRFVDLDTGKELDNVLKVVLTFESGGLRAALDFYDAQASRNHGFLRTVSRDFDQPDVRMRVEWSKPPKREG